MYERIQIEYSQDSRARKRGKAKESLFSVLDYFTLGFRSRYDKTYLETRGLAVIKCGVWKKGAL